MKVILTGATGMVGEGVLLECIQNAKISEILIVGRKKYDIQHKKVKQLIVNNFLMIADYSEELKGYDTCFFCAGISSVGLSEKDFKEITYDVTLSFAKAVLAENPAIVFNYVSGKGTDSTEKEGVMWARVKGKTENDLMKLGFQAQYNFRPALMLPFKEQRNVKPLLKILTQVLKYLMPSLTLSQVGQAMVNISEKGYSKSILEVSDIKKIANGENI